MRIGTNNPNPSIRGQALYGRRPSGTAGTPLKSGAETARLGGTAGDNTSTVSAPAMPPPGVLPGLSGEEYLALHQDSTAAYSPESRSAAEHQALMETADSGVAASPAAGTEPQAAAPADIDITILPTDTTEVKLAKLLQIAEASDYTGMSYEEIYTDLWNRYNNAFGGHLSVILGMATPFIDRDWAYINNQFGAETSKYVFKPLTNEFVAQGLTKRGENYDGNDYIMKRISDISSAPFGYSGMSFEEKEAAILEKYRGKNTFMDFLSMQGELQLTNVYRNKMGFERGHQFLSEMRSRLQIDFLYPIYMSDNGSLYTNDGRCKADFTAKELLSENQLYRTLYGEFDARAFLMKMKESLKDVTFSNYGYDVRKVIDDQIDDCIKMLDKCWGSESSTSA